MNLKSRKIISMALVFFMMLTILPMAPVTAFAAGSAGYFELGVVDGAANKWNVQISDAGVLSWDSQGAGATYEIWFAYTSDGHTLTFVKNLDENSCDLKKVFEDRSIENGTYYFVISAKVGGTSSSNVVAGYSFPLSLKYVSSLPKLAEPRNLSWDGTTAKWDSVPNATRYDVYIYATDGTTPDYRFDITATEHDFGSFAKDGRWFEVVAVADGYRDSNAAESPKYGTGSSAGYFKLGVVDGAANKWNVQISDAGVLSWDSQGAGATYEIWFAYTSDGHTLTFVKNLDENSCDLKKVFEDRSIENGTYYFVISAKVGGTSSSNVVAGYSFPLSLKYVSSLSKLAEPQNLSWEGTTAKWDSVPNATGYDVYIYATDGTTPDYRFDITATEYNFGSFAKDGRWFEVVAVADGYRDSNAAESPKYGEEVVTPPATTYTITATAGEGGTITPSGEVTVNKGEGYGFAIEPNEGYKIKDVIVDGTSVGVVTVYGFSNVEANHTIEAVFETTSTGTITGITINPTSAEVEKGKTYQFSATVSGEGDFDKGVLWSVAGNSDPTTTVSTEGLLTVGENELATILTVGAAAAGKTHKTAVAYVTVKTPSTGTITGITINPTSAEVEKGKTYQFSATVSGEGDFDKGVLWSVAGNSDSTTTVSTDGLLTVGENELATILTVGAAAAGKTHKTAVAYVTVKTPAPVKGDLNVIESNGVLTWPDYPGATHYALSITGYAGLDNNIESGFNLRQYLSEHGKPYGEYTYSIVARDDSLAEISNKHTATYDYQAAGETPEPIEYTINVNGGTASVGAGTPVDRAVAGTEITLTVDESKIPAGQVFDKWEVVSGDVAITDGKFTMPEKAVEIKATYKDQIYTVNYLVTLEYDNGSEPAKFLVESGATVTKPAAPEKEGFIFKGWFLGETEYDFATKVTGPITLIAKWEAKEVVPPCEHEYDNACDATCNKCDDVREAGHTGGTATCQAPATCTVCGQPYGETDANNHIYATEWTTDRSNHWHKATCGHDVITAKEAHSYGGDRVCDICNYKKPSSGGSYGGGSYVAPDKDADSKLRIVMQINNKNILVNGVTKVNDVAPVIVGDRTLVPIRVVTELLGGSADWDNATRTVTLKIDGKTMNMTIGKEIPGFGTSAVIMNDRTYVPVRYVMEKLGAEVEWINATRQIIIEK